MRVEEDTLAGVGNVAAVAGPWWVAHVKPSQEKRLAEELSAGEFPVCYYLPLVRRNSRQFGVDRQIRTPLMPGYLFFAGDGEERYRVVVTHRTVGIIRVVDQRKFVDQLRAMQLAVEENPKIMLYPKTPTGSRVKVTAGAYRGHEGVVEQIREKKRRYRLILRLDVTGAAVAVEVDSENVEPI